jgi:hypothetical protein
MIDFEGVTGGHASPITRTTLPQVTPNQEREKRESPGPKAGALFAQLKPASASSRQAAHSTYRFDIEEPGRPSRNYFGIGVATLRDRLSGLDVTPDAGVPASLYDDVVSAVEAYCGSLRAIRHG